MAESTESRMLGGEWLFAHLPADVEGSLDDQQRHAIREAADRGTWGRHPVNIRLSLPFVQKRFFLTVVGGEERRHPDRRSLERERHPIRTAANILFVIGIAAVFSVLAMFALALQSSLVEF